RAPLADRTVLSLLSRGAVPTLRRGTEDSLTARTRHMLSAAFHRTLAGRLRRGRQTVRAGRLPELQARALRALVLDEEESYAAFRFRW
ncbi:MAG: hypothetical protein ACQEXJ_23490, partial [Myxococcota bacterium]